MTAADTLNRLGQLQSLMLALVEAQCEDVIRRQYHDDLSPLGWHLGHCVYTETYWVQEVVQGDATQSAARQRLFTPELTPRPQRGPQLPPRAQLLDWAAAQFSDTLMRLANLTPPHRAHALLGDDYLPLFLLQHHTQHYETMLMVLTQRALQQIYPDYRARKGLIAAPDAGVIRTVPAGHYRIGGTPPLAFDNELPPQHAELGEFRIAAQPVSNAQYLAFMQAGGYDEARFWSAAGWTWRQTLESPRPEHWRRDADGAWFGVGVQGPYDLTADAPLHGINYYEASAFARWAKARLPHEFQWEAAHRSGLLAGAGRAWEWCDNSFYPYDGFKPFPYERYSMPWFDGTHFTLRGGSLHTRPILQRPSFRNFYSADKRHIFAGLRLSF